MLGPLLFALYINDLPNSIKSFAKPFADDLKMIAKASDKLQVDNDLKCWDYGRVLGYLSSMSKSVKYCIQVLIIIHIILII